MAYKGPCAVWTRYGVSRVSVTQHLRRLALRCFTAFHMANEKNAVTTAFRGISHLALYHYQVRNQNRRYKDGLWSTGAR